MTSSTPGDDARTEMIHDVDYPLDVPAVSGSAAGDTATTVFPSAETPGGDTATTAFPVAGAQPRATDYSQFAESGGYDVSSPLPFGEQPATIAPAPRDEVGQRGTADLGLFLLRVTVGLLLTLRGLQKLFGLFDGPGIDGMTLILTDAGYDRAQTLAVAGGAIELVAGVMLVIGLATPVAAAGLLGLTALGISIALSGTDPTPLLGESTRGLEAPVLYAAGLAALLFTGPGRWSVDRRWAWSYRPRYSGLIWLVVAGVTAGLVWYFLNGVNPLTAAVDSAPVPAG